LLKKIREKVKNKEELKERIKKKIEKFGGIISEEGAVVLVARDLGIRIESEDREKINIKDLKKDLSNIQIEGRLKHIFPERRIVKNGREKTLSRAIIEDDTGEVTLTVFGKRSKELQEFEKGDFIVLENAFVGEWNNRLQLNLGWKGKIELSKKGERKTKKLSELSKDNANVDIVGKITNMFNENIFKGGKLRAFILADDSGTKKVVAWNEQVDILKNFGVGDVIKIENAYMREGLKDLEINIGWRGRIKKLEEDMKTIRDIERKKISELKEGEFVEIAGRVNNIFREQEYIACERCGKKVEEEMGKFRCKEHGEVKGKLKKIFRIEIDDGTGRINASIFDREVKPGEYVVLRGRKRTTGDYEDFSVWQVVSHLKSLEAKKILEEI